MCRWAKAAWLSTSAAASTDVWNLISVVNFHYTGRQSGPYALSVNNPQPGLAWKTLRVLA
jgi:hypothetical protein